MFRNTELRSGFVLFAAVLAGSMVASNAFSQSSQGKQDPQVPAAPAGKPAAAAPSHYQPNRFSRRASLHYTQIWGVDSLAVKTVESGELVRFTYRVIDPSKAMVLNDKKAEPTLIDPQAGVSLVVPLVDKVGKLRQTSDPEAGRVYWMAFSNKGRPVKPGHRVNVVIGNFRADGLVVQ
jgi:hypothetical protein